MLSDRFGTMRGAARLALSYVEVGMRLAPIVRPAPDQVRRLVFVCHGNICRSAFAEAVARREELNTASFGLSIASGQPAHEPVITFACQSGLDLSRHRTTAVEDYEPRDGDLLLAMEVRHLRRLAAHQRLADTPRALLGIHAQTPFPHYQDPYGLSEAYLKVCLGRIERAVKRLCQLYPAAAAS